MTSGLDLSLSRVDTTLQGQGSDLVTQVRPNLQMTSRSGRVRGTLDYALEAVHHSRQVQGAAQGDSLQNTLNASASAEAIENFAYVDTYATIAQRAISAYGQQSLDGAQVNANRTEVSQIGIKPYVRGVLGGIANYQLGLTADAMHAKGAAAPDSGTSSVSLALSSARAGSKFGWGFQASEQRARFSGARSTDSGRASLTVNWRPDYDVNLGLRGGQESTNVGNTDRQSYTNWGVDASWTPSPRTTASYTTDRRYFGQSHALTLSQRFQRSTIRFTSSRDAATNGNPNGIGQPVTVYQLYFEQFTTVQPDPILRRQLVLDYLRSLGIDPNGAVGGGFVNSGVTLQRRQDLSMSYSGLRSNFTLQAYSSETSQLDQLTPVPGNGLVRQLGFTAGASYRLTPTASATLSGSQLRTLATATQAGNDLKSVSLSLTEQLGKRTSTSLSLRQSVFHGPVNPYRESSLSGNLSLRF